METNEAIFAAVSKPSPAGLSSRKNDVAGLLSSQHVAAAKHFFENVAIADSGAG